MTENPFNPEQDSEAINQAIQSNDDAQIENIINIICERTNDQRQQIKEKYISNYGVDLSEALNKKLSGDLGSLIKGLLYNPVDYDVEQIFKAIEGLGTDDEVLIEIISTRPSSHLQKVNKRYIELHPKETIEQAIIGDTSGAYQKLLVAMVHGVRSENPYPNCTKMKEAVEEIKNADKNMKESIFVKYFGSCSYNEVGTICSLYERMYKEPFLKMVEREFSGDTKKLFVSLLSYISDSGKYFAKILNKFKTKDLNRVLISRNEVDMQEIRDSYRTLYQTDLVEDIKEKTKDNYQKALLILAQK